MTTAQSQDTEVRLPEQDQEVRLPNSIPSRLKGRGDALDGGRLHGWIWAEASSCQWTRYSTWHR